MHRETLYASPAKRIELSIFKVRQSLVMTLQEWDRNAEGFESFVMFGSWSPTVARESCPRATKAAVERFYQAHVNEAKALVAAHVAVLESKVA